MPEGALDEVDVGFCEVVGADDGAALADAEPDDKIHWLLLQV